MKEAGDKDDVNGWDSYPQLVTSVNRDKQTFDRDCGRCHNDGLGSNTNEKMIRLDEVSRFFAPTIYQKEMQAIRATFLRDMYWVQSRLACPPALTPGVHRTRVRSAIWSNTS